MLGAEKKLASPDSLPTQNHLLHRVYPRETLSATGSLDASKYATASIVCNNGPALPSK